MTKCCVQGCGQIGIHRFPRDPIMKDLWIKATRNEALKIKDSTRLCRKHFLDSDYCDTSMYKGVVCSRKMLKKTAVPSLFLDEEHVTMPPQHKTHLVKLYLPITVDTPQTCGSATFKRKNKPDNSKSELKNKKSASEAQFYCNTCQASFRSRCLLYYHQLSHPYYCNICKKSFLNRTNLSNHECNVCGICGKHFASAFNLSRHKKIKCKKKSKNCKCCYYCPICSEQFPNEDKRMQHSEEFKFPCRSCKKCYKGSEELSVHQQLHLPKPAYRKICVKKVAVWSCLICKTQFNNTEAVNKHLRNTRHHAYNKKNINIIKGNAKIGGVHKSTNLNIETQVGKDIAVNNTNLTGAVNMIADKDILVPEGKQMTISNTLEKSKLIGEVSGITSKKTANKIANKNILVIESKQTRINHMAIGSARQKSKLTGEVGRISNIYKNSDITSLETEAVVKREVDDAINDSEKVWLELGVKKEPKNEDEVFLDVNADIKQSQNDLVFGIFKKEPSVDVGITPDVTVKVESIESQMEIKQEPEDS